MGKTYTIYSAKDSSLRKSLYELALGLAAKDSSLRKMLYELESGRIVEAVAHLRDRLDVVAARS